MSMGLEEMLWPIKLNNSSNRGENRSGEGAGDGDNVASIVGTGVIVGDAVVGTIGTDSRTSVGGAGASPAF